MGKENSEDSMQNKTRQEKRNKEAVSLPDSCKATLNIQKLRTNQKLTNNDNSSKLQQEHCLGMVNNKLLGGGGVYG